MSKRATMVDIALAAGVSQATVSLVLNRIANARVSPDTRARVLAAAEQLGYAPRRSLTRATGTRLIGLLIDEVTTTPFAAHLIEGARDEAAARGGIVAVFCTGSDAGAEGAAFDVLAAAGGTGVLYTSLISRRITPPAQLSGMPAVLLNCHDAARKLPSVLPGDVAGGFAATTALIDAGHRRIAHIAGEHWGESARDRTRGFRQALATADIAPDPALIEGPAWTVDSGRDATLRLLDLPAPPTAIFCFNDRAAIGCYEALAMRGLRIPEDISVIGFDNEDMSANLLPPLSTVVLPHYEMARWAVGMLLDTPQPQVAAQIKIECPTVLRASIGPPAAR